MKMTNDEIKVLAQEMLAQMKAGAPSVTGAATVLQGPGPGPCPAYQVIHGCPPYAIYCSYYPCEHSVCCDMFRGLGDLKNAVIQEMSREDLAKYQSAVEVVAQATARALVKSSATKTQSAK